jgi:hypothetical protein
MSDAKRVASVVLLGGLISGLCGTTARAGDTAEPNEPNEQQLLDEIKTLRSRVEQLQQQQQKQEAQQKTDAKTVAATADDVIRDADRHSQLMEAQGFTAGYTNHKFIIQSEDGAFSLNPNFQFQTRYVLNNRAEDATSEVAGRAATESGFEISRIKMAFEGNVFGPDTKYKFQWDAGSNGGHNGNLTLEEAYVMHRLNFAPDMWIKGGQFKDPTFHEELTSSKRQLAVDRSLANEVLGGGQTDYIQGVGLIWDDGPEGLPFRAEAGFTDGPNSDNTNFVDGGGAPIFDVANPDWGVYGRAEYLVFGDWNDYQDFTTLGNVQDTLVLGAGAFYTQRGATNVLLHTFDAQYEYNKLGLYAAYYGVYSDSSTTGGSTYNVGCTLQAGYLINERWEAFARYSLVSLDMAGAGSDNFHEFTAGVNYYIKGPAAKFTFDVSYLPDGSPSNQPQIGVLDPDADDQQFVFRGQFQLLL